MMIVAVVMMMMTTTRRRRGRHLSERLKLLRPGPRTLDATRQWLAGAHAPLAARCAGSESETRAMLPSQLESRSAGSGRAAVKLAPPSSLRASKRWPATRHTST